MLPFLKQELEGSTAVKEDPVKRKPDDDSDYDGLQAAADDLIQAIANGDSKGVAAALRAAFDLCDSEPHQEGEHV